MSIQPSKRKPHRHLAGYVFERKFKDGHLVCYIADDAGICSEHKYVVVWERAESIIGLSFTSERKARAFVKESAQGTTDYWETLMEDLDD